MLQAWYFGKKETHGMLRKEKGYKTLKLCLKTIETEEANVVMYYSTCGEYPGLFLLGEPISGEDSIEKMSGSIHVEVYEE